MPLSPPRPPEPPLAPSTETVPFTNPSSEKELKIPAPKTEPPLPPSPPIPDCCAAPPSPPRPPNKVLFERVMVVMIATPPTMFSPPPAAKGGALYIAVGDVRINHNSFQMNTARGGLGGTGG